MVITTGLLTPQQRYEVAYWLEQMESPDRVADRTRVPLETVRELAQSIGWPANEKRMRGAVTQLAAKPGVTPIQEPDTTPETTVPTGPPAGESPGIPLPGAVDGVAPLDVDLSGPGLVDVQRRLIPVKILTADPDNPRDDVVDDDLVALAESIRSVGLLQDIVVRRIQPYPDAIRRFVVVAGHRRLAAVKLLGWSEVYVLDRGPMSRDQVLAAMLTENSHRKDLDPVLQAHAIEQLRVALGGPNVPHAVVAQKLGRTQVWVSERLSLLALNREDQAKLRRGDMTLGEAVRTARLEKGTARASRPGTRMHLANLHPLAHLARNRCDRLGHPRGARVGAVACGECWEQVIRANERQDATADSYQRGVCVCCQQPMPKRSTGSGEQL